MKNNVKILRENNDLTIKKVCELLDISRQHYYNIENKNSAIVPDIQEKMTKIFNCNLNDLYRDNLTKDNFKLENNIIKIKYFADLLKITSCEDLENPSYYQMIDFGEKFFEVAEIRQSPKNIILIKMPDNSMFSTIQSGELIFIDTTETKVKQNGIYLIIENGISQIKRIKLIDENMLQVQITTDNKLDLNYIESNKTVQNINKYICGMKVYQGKK